MASNAPDPAAGQVDFIKGWPARYMLEREEFVEALKSSHALALKDIGSCLNYGTNEEGAWMKAFAHAAYLFTLNRIQSNCCCQLCDRAIRPSSVLSLSFSPTGIPFRCNYYIQKSSIRKPVAGISEMLPLRLWSRQVVAPWEPTSLEASTLRFPNSYCHPFADHGT